MARVSLLDKGLAPPESVAMFQKMEEKGFQILNLYKVMAHCPQIARHFFALGNAILFKGTVPPKLRELAVLRVGNLCRARYEFSHHLSIARDAGVRPEQIKTLPDWEKSGHFDAEEKAVLRYTDEVSMNIRVNDASFAALQHFLSEEAIVELTTTVSYYGMVCRVLEALQVELEKDVGLFATQLAGEEG